MSERINLRNGKYRTIKIAKPGLFYLLGVEILSITVVVDHVVKVSELVVRLGAPVLGHLEHS